VAANLFERKGLRTNFWSGVPFFGYWGWKSSDFVHDVEIIFVAESPAARRKSGNVDQPQEGRGIGILNKIRAYALQDAGADTVEANERLDLPVDARDYRQCAEVLFDLGLCKVKVISNNPGKLRALEEAGLEIVERVSIEVESSEPAARYLQTKKDKMGHLLNLKAS